MKDIELVIFSEADHVYRKWPTTSMMLMSLVTFPNLYSIGSARYFHGDV